ncbi:MAG: PQQ-binding-like beta-propeller repeat protein [Prolixibacteraceae bacterium]
MKRASSIFSLFVLIFAFTISISAQDWPQWRGVKSDGNVSGFKAPSSWPTELKQEWKVTVGLGDAGPVLVGNKLYSFSRQENDEVLLCLDAISGKEIWQNKYPAITVTGPSASHPGPRSTPAVAEGKIVTLGVGGVLSCLDATSGKLVWRKENTSNLNPPFFTAMSPMIVNGKCIAFLGGKESGTIFAFDLVTGSETWKWAGDGPTYSSPVVMTIDGKKQLVVYTEKNLVGLDAADGKLLWKVDAPCQNRFYNAATPVVLGQTVIITGQGSGTKAIEIVKEGDEFVTKELWANAELGTKYNTPVIQDGLLYGLSNGRKFYSLDVKNGLTMWADTTMNSDFGALLNCGSAIISLPSNSNLIVFKPGQKSYSELTRIKVSDKPVFSTPVVSGNKIYIKDAEILTLYKFN